MRKGTPSRGNRKGGGRRFTGFEPEKGGGGKWFHDECMDMNLKRWGTRGHMAYTHKERTTAQEQVIPYEEKCVCTRICHK